MNAIKYVSSLNMSKKIIMNPIDTCSMEQSLSEDNNISFIKLISDIIILRETSSMPVVSSLCDKINNLQGIILSSTNMKTNSRDVDWRSGTVSRDTSVSWKTAEQSKKIYRQPQYTGPPIGRYQSPFKLQKCQIEDKILNNIRMKLNKFSVATYDEIRNFIFQILGDESSSDDVKTFVFAFMTMVFKKAAEEETYCPLYAKLLKEIGSIHPIIFEELSRLYTNYMEIFDEVGVNIFAVGVSEFEQKNIDKKYRQGYSQFIAELTGLEILSLESLTLLCSKIISLIITYSQQTDKKPLIDEYVDCLLKMSKVLKTKKTPFFNQIKQGILRDNNDKLINLINPKNEHISLSSKSRFLLMDIYDIIKV